MSTIRPEFHTNVVSQILNDIYYKRSNYYYFLGKIDPWNDTEEAPVAPNNASSEDITIRDNILYLRKIMPADVALVTTSYAWNSGTVYDYWDDKIEMLGKAFYVVTDEYNVYKCLDNNNGVESTVSPTTTSLFPFRTSDGYLWKYMYNIPAFKRQKFLSRGFLPVQKALSDTFYNKGAIESVSVTNPGSGYTDEQLTKIIVTGTTTGSGGAASIATVSPLGQITGLTVISGGTGYTKGANVKITSSTGSGAVITPTTSGGSITGFTIVSGGAGYTIDDDVTITVGGASVIPVISRLTGSFVDIKIINGGAGYSGTPTLSIAQVPNTGTGVYGNATAVIKPIMYNGSIVRVTIEDPGTGYPADTNTTIVVIGDGVGAAFTPVIYNGELIDIVVDNPGTNYSYATIVITGTGNNASALAVLATSDFLSDQSQVEQVAVKGAIYKCVITEQGNNYSEEATITIVGDGEGAEGYPIVENGSITQIVMTSYGQNYTYASIVVQDPNRLEPNDFIDMSSYAVFPPNMGHGYDAVRELYGDTMCIYNLIKGDAELNLIAQDYRQYGILVNPVDILTNKRIVSNINIVSFKASVMNADSIVVDDILICDNKRYRVVSVDNNIVEVQQLNLVYSRPSGYFYKESNPSTQYSIISIISIPNVNKYSGNLLYVTNNTPFTPTSEQTIAIRTYIKI